MFVRSIAHKKGSIHNLVKYISKGLLDSSSGFEYRHNVIYHEHDKITAEFMKNATFKHGRMESVCYHEFFSVHTEDSSLVTRDMLLDLTKNYIRIRGLSDSLVYACTHQDTDRLHVHLAVSSNKLKSKRSNRMDKATLNTVQKSFEAYHMKHYPELTQSVIFHQGKQKQKLQNIALELNRMYQRAESPEHFYSLVSESYVLNIRGNKPNGIRIGNAVHRFSKLGISKAKLASLFHFENRLSEIQSLSQSNDHTRDPDFF